MGTWHAEGVSALIHHPAPISAEMRNKTITLTQSLNLPLAQGWKIPDWGQQGEGGPGGVRSPCCHSMVTLQGDTAMATLPG